MWTPTTALGGPFLRFFFFCGDWLDVCAQPVSSAYLFPRPSWSARQVCNPSPPSHPLTSVQEATCGTDLVQLPSVVRIEITSAIAEFTQSCECHNNAHSGKRASYISKARCSSDGCWRDRAMLR